MIVLKKEIVDFKSDPQLQKWFLTIRATPANPSISNSNPSVTNLTIKGKRLEQTVASFASSSTLPRTAPQKALSFAILAPSANLEGAESKKIDNLNSYTINIIVLVF